MLHGRQAKIEPILPLGLGTVADLCFTAAGLDAFAVDLEADNRVVTQKLTIADDAIKTRGDMYENEDTGLLARIKLMKSYVSGEIGKKSEVYLQLVALHI